MAYDQVDIPLGQKLKVCLFGQDHPEHGMCLLQSAFLPTAHRVAVIDTGTLDPCKTGFQGFRISKLGSPVSENVFKRCLKIISTKHFSSRSKTSLTAPSVLRFIRKARNIFFLVKKKVSSVLEEPEAECTVSISQKEDSPNCWKSA